MIRSMGLYLAWGVIGFIATFTVLYGFTPAGPVIVLLVWLAYRNLPTISGSRRPEAFGTLAGFGAFWLFVATTVDGDPAPFALVGAVALGVSMLSYLMGGRDRCVNDLSTG